MTEGAREMDHARSEPSLKQVRDEVIGALGIDHRVRAVEIEQAITRTAMDGLTHEVRGMKGELLAAIAESRPKPVWPAVSALVACVALILLVAQSLYGG